MQDTERDRIFGEWLAVHKGILFKVATRMPSSMATGRIFFKRSRCSSGARWTRSVAIPPYPRGCIAVPSRSTPAAYHAARRRGDESPPDARHCPGGAGGIGPIAIGLLGLRINQKSFSDDGGMLIPLLFVCVWSVATGIWEIRRQARNLLPRKRQLEALLKELDGEE
jgi:hypothetical protein